jgi:hypothetical protein
MIPSWLLYRYTRLPHVNQIKTSPEAFWHKRFRDDYVQIEVTKTYDYIDTSGEHSHFHTSFITIPCLLFCATSTSRVSRASHTWDNLLDPQARLSVSCTPSMHGLPSALVEPLLALESQHPSSSQDLTESRISKNRAVPSSVVGKLLSYWSQPISSAEPWTFFRARSTRLHTRSQRWFIPSELRAAC